VLPGRRATRSGGRGRCCGGNAGRKGGTPTAASGSVVGLDRDITASDEIGTAAERLTGLIQVDAKVQAGDSGGPLYAGGAVIGIDTAASTAGRVSGVVRGSPAAAVGLRAGDTITAVDGVAVDRPAPCRTRWRATARRTACRSR
jgi:S1-C subfamily serine protease